ncbi:Vir protein [Legionella longbeachae]|uniref:Vir protein n=1 Tax=Legionella longbeachae TaxID=450 RepID=UPI001CC20772|nr:Vir protein [Legionella longbeachae]
MKKIPNQTPVQATSYSSERPEIKDTRIDTLFFRFGAIYGHLWLSLHQNERLLAFAKKEWSEGLCSFDNTTVKEVLLKCREQNAYPPTLPQFIEQCKNIKKRKEAYVSSGYAKDHICRPDIAKKHLKNMLEFLKR